MNTEKIGEIFVDGRIINLDNNSVDVLSSILEKIEQNKKNTIDRLNKILSEI